MGVNLGDQIPPIVLIKSQGTAHVFGLRQIKAIVFAVISEAGAEPSVLWYIYRKDTTSLMGGADAQTVGTVGDAHSTLNVDLLTLLVVHLKGHATTGASHEMSSLGIKIHQ